MLQINRNQQGTIDSRLLFCGAMILLLLTMTGNAQQVATRKAVRTLTNQDLEVSRQLREQKERTSKLTRVHLPSDQQLEESRKRDETFLRDAAALEASQQTNAEGYWRARSAALRTEISTLDAQLNYLRTKIAEISTPVTTPYALTTSVPYYYGRRRHYPSTGFPILNNNAPQMNEGLVAPPPQLSARVSVGRGSVQGWMGVNPMINGPVITRGQAFTGFYAAPSVIYSEPYNSYNNYSSNYSYERDALVLRFNELQTQRAGMIARWRALEDEARVAGALPGWLR